MGDGRISWAVESWGYTSLMDAFAHFDLGSWTHIVLRVDNDGTRMIRKNGLGDGMIVSYGTMPQVTTRAYHSIGCLREGTSNFLHGSIAYLRMFDTPIESAEIYNM
ncbi:hypothetical protein TL16_g13101 [Triparma laevis f. inornata]|uniref:Uncharacterized protein n=2 Tax=Triparma laevis TaxID=1534972 RepID=A0A9W6ZMF5_9STRA|nr:hypothetical protein TrLO_g9999 [Triparma laevis f. longispina]GMH95205.1 hypothetical protein TL16_g13101 [Triparma laevis f. inornata]